MSIETRTPMKGVDREKFDAVKYTDFNHHLKYKVSESKAFLVDRSKDRSILVDDNIKDDPAINKSISYVMSPRLTSKSKLGKKVKSRSKISTSL